jgi:predicted nucleotidyltransferase
MAILYGSRAKGNYKPDLIDHMERVGVPFCEREAVPLVRAKKLK